MPVWFGIERRRNKNGLKGYYLDEDEKRIARSLVRLEDKRRRGKLKRRTTSFDRRTHEAIEKANADIALTSDLLNKIRQNIIDGTAWEYLGDTYCGRDTFYRYARIYLFYVARNMGITEDTKKKGGDRG